MNNNGNPQIVPFGKYKGQPMEILANDPNYVEWLNGQGWVKDKYPQFYTVIINNFQEPSDTPEHNALQAMFLDDELCRRFLSLVEKTLCRDGFVTYDPISKRFEIEGIDVILNYYYWLPSKYIENIINRDSYRRNYYQKHKSYPDDASIRAWALWHATPQGSCAVEIKPSIGDDFPSVLRQACHMKGHYDSRCVVFRDFVTTSVTLKQVKEMFRHSGIYLFCLAEIEQTDADRHPHADVLRNLELEDGIEHLNPKVKTNDH